MAARLRAADRRRFRLDGRCRAHGVENGKGNDVRIIAGEHRGRRLEAPKGDGTRPTIDRVRESLMSALASARGGFDDAVVLDAFAGSGALGLEALSRGAACACFCEKDASAASALASARGGFDDAVVLDAFAGSGALGLEALSRGAACACFCEKDASAAKVVEANICTLGYSRDVARLLRTDVLKSAPSRMRRPYDLIMLDPPYATSAREVFSLLSRLDDACALAPGALIYDLIMLDPPYATSAREVFSLLSRLDDACALAPGALITYEHDADDCEAVDEQTSRFPRVGFTRCRARSTAAPSSTYWKNLKRSSR